VGDLVRGFRLHSIDLTDLKNTLDASVKGTCLEYKIKSVDLKETKIETLLQIEQIFDK